VPRLAAGLADCDNFHVLTLPAPCSMFRSCRAQRRDLKRHRGAATEIRRAPFSFIVIATGDAAVRSFRLREEAARSFR